MCSVEVQLELGHKASPRLKPTNEGYTHDWTVFVRGADGCNIKYFAEKVIFQLHESFPKPRRVVKEPPYQVSESGYAGFELPIEIYFRNKEEPKKITFEYDLFLRVNEICNNSRKEKLTFQNPNNDFKKKLLKAGGIINEKSMVLSSTSSSNDENHNHSSSSKSAKPHHDRTNDARKSSKMTSVIPSKDKSLQNQQVSTSIPSSSYHSHSTSEKNTSLQSQSQSTSSLQSQFTDLFGTPIQARPSPDSSKFKDNTQQKKPGSSDNNNATNNKKPSHVKESIKKADLNKIIDKEKKSKPSSNNKDLNALKEKIKSKLTDDSPKIKKENQSNKHKVSTQSSSLFLDADSSLDGKISNKKRKRNDLNLSSPLFTNTSSNSEKKEKDSSLNLLNKNDDKLSKKESKKQRMSKDVIVSSASGANNVNHKLKDVKIESSTSTTISFSNNNNTGTTTLEIKSVKKEKTWDNEVKKSRNKEHKSKEIKPSKENLNKVSNKIQAKDEMKSPKEISNIKFNKVPKKEKDSTSFNLKEEASSSPASVISGSLTPGGINYVGAPSSTSSINGPISAIIAEMDQESLPVSPLSSCDPDSPSLAFGSKSKVLIDSDDDFKNFKSSKESLQKSKKAEKLKKLDVDVNRSVQESKFDTNNKKRKDLNKANKGTSNSKIDTLQNMQESSSKSNQDVQYIKELILLKKKISELRDSELLQKIVDIIEETGLFNLTDTSIDFDLMQLDKYTVKRIKTCLIENVI